VASAADRTLRWEACHNARDLGGLETRDGRRTRWGALVRADLLCRLTEAGRAAVRAHGVRTVVDLRGPEEIAAEPNPFCRPGGDGPLYLNLPVDEERAAAVAAAMQAAGSAAERYCASLDGNQMRIARIASGIAGAPAGGVVVHCHAGKDRTGLVVALLLALVGVPDEVIAEEYALSGRNLEPLTREWLDRYARDEAERAEMARRAVPHPEVMLDTLAHLRARHGGAERYLLAGGASAAELAALRERLVEPGGAGAGRPG
jgi:protein-tyrosine phosphatase